MSPRQIASTKHGMYYSPEYKAWDQMIQRCNNVRNTSYDNYGRRGIKVHKSWLNFVKFYEHIGPRPSPRHSLDRIDNEKNYEPGNVRWALTSTQQHNRRTWAKSGYKGVSVNQSGRFFSEICRDGKRIYLGTFGTAIEAHRAYKEKSRELYAQA